MPIFKIPVQWSVYDHYEIEADTLEEACEDANEQCLPNGDYIEDSFEIGYDGIEEYPPLD